MFSWYICNWSPRQKKRLQHTVWQTFGIIIFFGGGRIAPPQKNAWNKHCTPSAADCLSGTLSEHTLMTGCLSYTPKMTLTARHEKQVGLLKKISRVTAYQGLGKWVFHSKNLMLHPTATAPSQSERWYGKSWHRPPPSKVHFTSEESWPHMIDMLPWAHIPESTPDSQSADYSLQCGSTKWMNPYEILQ